MSLGSYYTANYYGNPVPYDASDVGEPVPGWGTTVRVAGPARLGVGAFGQQLFTPTTAKKLGIQRPRTTTPFPVIAEPTPEPDKPTPWWIWPVAAAVVLGGVGYYGTKKGWL